MSAQPRDSDIDQDIERELVRRLGEAEAEHRPAELVLAGRRYRLVPMEDVRVKEDPFKDYDPERALAAVERIRASGGILNGLDTEAFMEEIMESRVQDTPGRRWP